MYTSVLVCYFVFQRTFSCDRKLLTICMLLVAYVMSIYIMQCKIMFPLFYGSKPPTLFSGGPKGPRFTVAFFGCGGGG